MSSSGKRTYSQKFRSEWLKDPLLLEWLQYEDVPTNDGHEKISVVRRPKCIYCQQLLSLRYMDLTKHATTSKHKKNMRALPSASSSSVKPDPTPKDELVPVKKRCVDKYPDPDEQTDFEETNALVGELPVLAVLDPTPTRRSLVVSEAGNISFESPVYQMASHQTEKNETVVEDAGITVQSMDSLRLQRMEVELEQERVKLYMMKLDALVKEKNLGMRRRSRFTMNL